MITTLTATTTSRIVSRLVEHEGTSGSSRVLTLVISTDEGAWRVRCAPRTVPAGIIPAASSPSSSHLRRTPPAERPHAAATDTSRPRPEGTWTPRSVSATMLVPARHWS